MKIVSKIVNFSTKHPIIVLVGVVLVSLAFVVPLKDFKMDIDIKGNFSENDETIIMWEYLNAVFESPDAVLLVSVTADNIYSDEVIQYVKKIHGLIEEQDYIKEVTSLVNAGAIDVVNDGGSEVLEAVDFFPENDNGERIIHKTKSEYENMKQVIENDPFLSKSLVSQKMNDKGNPKAVSIIAEFTTNDNNFYYDKFVDLDAKIKKIIDPKYETVVFGNNYYLDYIANKSMEEDAQFQGIAIMVLLLLVYFLNFKSVRGVVLPLLINAISAIWVFGIMVLIGIQIAEMEIMVVILLLAISSSYSIHLLNQYYKDCHAYTKENKAENIAKSTKYIIGTIMFAGLTTFIGMSTFILSDIVHFRNYGIFSGVGVIFAVILSFTFVPALLRLLPISVKKRHKQFNNKMTDKILKKVTVFLIRNKVAVFIVLSAILITVVVLGVPNVSTELSFEEMFRQGHPVQELSEHFSENYGSTYTIDVVIDANPEHEHNMKKQLEDIKNNRKTKTTKEILGLVETPEENSNSNNESETLFDSDSDGETLFDSGSGGETLFDSGSGGETLFDSDGNDDIGNDIDLTIEIDESKRHALKSDFLKEVNKMSKYFENNVNSVNQVVSIATVLTHFNYVWNGKSQEYNNIPDTDTIAAYMELFQGDDENYNGVADDFESLIDPTFNKILLTITLEHPEGRYLNTDDYRRIQQNIIEYMDTEFKGNVYYSIGGLTIIISEMEERMLLSLVISLILATGGVALIVTILFKSLKQGLISMVPMLFAILLNFGIMGLTGIPLSAQVTILGTLIIGIGIDDTIHFMLRIRKDIKNSKEHNHSIEEIVYRTIRHTGKAIIFTSVALIVSFGVFMTSVVIALQHFGALIVLTMFNALVGTLLYLPSILLMFPSIVGIKKKEGKAFVADDSFLYDFENEHKSEDQQ